MFSVLYISDYISYKLILLFLILSSISSIIYFQFFNKLDISFSFQYLDKKDLVYLALAAIVFSFLVSEAVYYRLPVRNSLEIISTGEQSALSKGAEVWLLNRTHSFSNNLSLGDISFSKGWMLKGNDMVAYRRSPAVARWTGWSHLNEQIFFLKHQWSGKVLVKWGEWQNIYDLYSSTRGYQKVVLPKVENPSFTFLIKVCAGLLTFCLLIPVLSLMRFLPAKLGIKWLDGF